MQNTISTTLPPPGAYLKGYLLVIVAAVSYGLQPLFAFQAYADGATPLGLLLCRYIIAFTLLLAWLRWRNIKLPAGIVISTYEELQIVALIVIDLFDPPKIGRK